MNTTWKITTEHTTADAIAKARWGLKFIASDPRPLAAVEAACAAWRDPTPANKKAAVKAGNACSRFHTEHHRVCFGMSCQLDAATAAACAAYAAGADNPDREAMCINGAMGAFPYQFPEQHAAYQDPKYYPASR